jgi:hypothetical protein
MATYFIAPFEPVNNPEQWESLTHVSNLVIDPGSYKKKLAEDWPLAKFFETVGSALVLWSLYTEEEGKIIFATIGYLQDNQQIVALDSPHIAFFLWHRSVIPKKYRLWLFKDTSWNSIELRPDTTADEVREFMESI